VVEEAAVDGREMALAGVGAAFVAGSGAGGEMPPYGLAAAAAWHRERLDVHDRDAGERVMRLGEHVALSEAGQDAEAGGVVGHHCSGVKTSLSQAPASGSTLNSAL